MNELYLVVIGAVIGIIGTLLGAVVSHRLDLRRDRILGELEAKKQFRSKLLEGVLTTSEKHGRAQIPFAGGDSLYFPAEVETPEKVIEKIKIEVDQILDTEKKSTASDALQVILEYVQELNRQ